MQPRQANGVDIHCLGAACSGLGWDKSPSELHVHQCMQQGQQTDELEATVWQENYDLVAITETRWDHSREWGAAVDGYKFSGRDRRRREDSGGVLYVREYFYVVELSAGNDKVKSLWVRIRGKPNNTDILVVILQTPNQDEKADKAFCEQLAEIT